MELRYTPLARADLRELYDYISDELGNPTAAGNIVRRILGYCSILKEQPFCGAALSAKTGRETDLRYLICDRHIAFYRIDDSHVSVVRILDGRMDYMKILFGEK